jgi:hypothetical protein
MSFHVLGLRHDLKVRRIVVVLVAIDVVHNFVPLKRTAKHLLSNDPMLVPAVKLSVGIGLDLFNAAQLCGPVVGSTLVFWRQVVGIAVTANTLRVHPAHTVKAFARRVLASFDAASVCHGATRQIPATVGKCRQLSVRDRETHGT